LREDDALNLLVDGRIRSKESAASQGGGVRERRQPEQASGEQAREPRCQARVHFGLRLW
jgi:hypothetical protein